MPTIKDITRLDLTDPSALVKLLLDSNDELIIANDKLIRYTSRIRLSDAMIIDATTCMRMVDEEASLLASKMEQIPADLQESIKKLFKYTETYIAELKTYLCEIEKLNNITTEEL